MTYWRPDHLDEALNLLTENPYIAAGCTDLFPATDRPDLMIGRDRPILDITGIKALRGLSHDEGGLRIGATTSWTDIIRADLPPALDALKLAAREVGSIQIQNSGTIAGNVCNASPAADGVPALLILDAEVELQSTGTKRRLALAEFIQGPRKTDLRAGEMVTAIYLPNASLQGQSSFAKLGARRYLVISIVMVAIKLVIEQGRIKDAAIAVGACSAVATRLPKLEADLVAGRPFDNATIAEALAPITDLRADADYRLSAAIILVQGMLGALRGSQDQAA